MDVRYSQVPDDADVNVDGSDISSLRSRASASQEDIRDRAEDEDSEADFEAGSKAVVNDLTNDPFSPLDGLSEDGKNIVTLRAMAVGVVCGAFVNASNIYLGLKSGWGLSANLFASIVGFAILKSSPEILKTWLPCLAADFGPRENNIVQTAATAAGGMSNAFTSAFPAMYQLGLLNDPLRDYWRLVALSMVGGYFGFFFATPLRNFFVLGVARELRLIFPTPSATAVTIRDMHQAISQKSSVPRRKMKVLSAMFAFAIGLRVVSQFAIGLLWDWHPFTWYLAVFPTSAAARNLESWGWFIEWSPAFIGNGMVVGLSIAINFFAGSVLAWGIIGPLLVSHELAFGQVMDDGTTSYHAMSDGFTNAYHASPRYWLLWPGVACMIAVSLTELCCQWRIFWLSAKLAFSTLVKWISSLKRASRAHIDEKEEAERFIPVEDSTSSEEQVTALMWAPGLFATFGLALFVMKAQFEIPLPESILTLFMTFVFSVIAVQATGATDITPLSAASTSSQIVLGSSTSKQGWPLAKAQQLSLIGGALASIGASQAADLVGDFRVGFLLRTSPRAQWVAQAIGTLFASFFAPGIYVLFVTAYKCVHDVNDIQCAFQAPSASAWRAIAIAATDTKSSIPPSSLIFTYAFVTFGISSVLVRHLLWTGEREWIKRYHPNMIVVSLGLIIPASIYATAMLMGALLMWVWKKKHPKSNAIYAIAVAAGLMAGEGIGGVINAAMQLLGISGDVYGTQTGCPGGRC